MKNKLYRYNFSVSMSTKIAGNSDRFDRCPA
jgi:hypothetical protein